MPRTGDYNLMTLGKEIMEMKIWMDEDQNVYFHEVLFALIRRTFKMSSIPLFKEAEIGHAYIEF